MTDTQPHSGVPKQDVVERLRNIATCIPGRVCGGSGIFEYAADEIVRLRAIVAAGEELAGVVQDIVSGDPSNISSPIGPLHAAGMHLAWNADCSILRPALENYHVAKAGVTGEGK